MAGFTLGSSTSTTHQHPQSQIPHEGFFLYRSNDEISNKGFELWHQQQQQQQQQQQRHPYHHQHTQQLDNNNNNNLYFSSSSLALCSSSDHPSRRPTNVSPPSDHHDLGSSARVGVGMNMLMMRSQGGVSCQDCGNQAKKDCMHMRCRTCCKGRGFQCQTHVKSTWVPASRRRERQQQLASLQQQQHHPQRGGRGESSAKRLRENSSSSALACTTRLSSSGGLEDFPAEVNTPAVFRCVRVSSMVDDSEDQPLQYAYQAAVNIGGHVFKGILYDQGMETHYGESSSGGGGEVTRCLMTSAAETTTTAMNVSGTGGGGGAALIDPTSLYPTPLNAFVAGTHFFGHPRS